MGRAILLTLLFVLLALCCGITVQATEYVWVETGSMNTGRAYHTATLLSSGKVLGAGGMCAYSHVGTNSCELYDPSTGSWSITGSLNEARFAHTSTLLSDGRVLVAGGVDKSGSEGNLLSSCEIFDPTTEEWTLTGSLNIPREWHVAALLLTGKVLVAGGNSFGGGFPWGSSCELYDPTTGLWTIIDSLSVGRDNALGVLLPNGEFLIAGGELGPGPPWETASCELFDPFAETWRNTTSMNNARVWAAGTLLQNGKYLVTGGGGLGVPRPTIASCEIYDPATETWTVTGSLNFETWGHTTTLLSSGEAVVVGWGLSELYNPETGVWTYMGYTVYNRAQHTATLLANGNVLITGGIVDEATTSCELLMLTPQPLSVSVSPLSASIPVGESVTFTLTVTGGYPPYTFQWYLNDDPVSGANESSWTFIPTVSGIYYVHLKVTDAEDNTAQSETARVTVAAVPVGGYSLPIKDCTTTKLLTLHLALVAILTSIFTIVKRKTHKRAKRYPY